MLGKLVEIAIQPTLVISEQTIPNYKIWVIQNYHFNQGPAGINERPLKETPRSMFDMAPKLNGNNQPVVVPPIVPNESNGKEAETAKRQADIKALSLTGLVPPIVPNESNFNTRFAN